MRKILSIILALLAAFSVYTSVYAENLSIDTIKIGLFYGGTAKDAVTIGANGGFNLGYFENGEFISQYTIEENAVTVCAGEGNTVAIGDYIYDEAQCPTLYPIDGTVTVEGTEYRGGVQFIRRNGGKLTVINIVNIEEYLYGVVGREMSPSWSIEALKAQAVCARGFAISNKNKFADYGFNLDTTTTSQVYAGVSAETESVRRAVDETYGQVLMHGGEIIESIYCASMGGASANAENVWGGRYPYLVSVADIYENPAEATRYSWSVTLTAEEIKACLANQGVNIGNITNVQIIKQDDAGYVLELKFTGTSGTHTVTKSACRGIFGGKLHSQRYTIAGGASRSALLNIKNTGGMQIASSMARLFGIEIPENYGVLQRSTSAPKSYTFNGNGWGHGVGMSQWGAKAMADQGFAYGDILTFYYTGTYLENVY